MRPFDNAAVAYVAETCELWTEVGGWLVRRRPIGLRVEAAERSGQSLLRFTYIGADGFPRRRSRWVTRAAERLHLGWAVAGWLVRMPGVGWVLQPITDAVGGGPRELAGERTGWTPETVTR